MSIDQVRGRKACEGCGFEREVTVTWMGVAEDRRPYWDKFCVVCVLRARARTQRSQAAKNESKAHDLDTRRRDGEEVE